MKTHQKTNKYSYTIWMYLLGVVVLSIFVMGCSSDDTESATLKVRLTDSPGEYEQVNVDIQQVQVHSNAGDQDSGWKTLEMVEKGVYDLLTLTNGFDTLLADEDVPAGKISQIRLILGANNTVKVDGEVFPLATPSAQQSGLKLNVNETLKAGVTYSLLLDFDAAQSVIKHGNGTYSLKPVIHVVSLATSGSIEGSITPALAAPAIFVVAGTDTVATAYSDEEGNFLIRGVPAGTYTVSFDPKPGYQPQQKDNVVVTVGEVTDLGIITIL